MFPGLFNQDNPWYSSWHTSSKVEDAQTIPIDTLFDDNEMSSVLNINYCCGLFTDYISARVHYSRHS